MAAADETRQCPYCKEQIKSEAIKCKHCGSRIEPARPDHGGTCPLCKESINPEAVVCKHCKSNLQDAKECACSHEHSMRMGLSLGPGIFTASRPCQTWCVGSTLMCACPVRTPYGEGLLVYACGTCINDPILTAREGFAPANSLRGA